ncbi:hypothetical protein [Nocardia sp. 852002-20019_SCH5090214]|uniref:hypothetical protein n=1 Tax=Nocardia sp. 852002-20019_SCH5090214 TaxID=1834087 RepID=UPI0012E9E905|nr:hypothetical protein [Nocardia sp. 852002-20019_SCH5090214]
MLTSRVFRGRRISVTSIANVSDECDELEFREEGKSTPIVVVSEQDNSPGDLFVSIYGQADAEFVRFAIAAAEEYFSE